MQDETKYTKEELKQILDDFKLYKKVWDEKIHPTHYDFPNPNNDKTRLEEVNDYRKKAIPPLHDLLYPGGVKSNEVKNALKEKIEYYEASMPEKIYPVTILSFVKSSDMKPIGDLTLDEMVEYLEKALDGKLPEDKMKTLNKDLEKLEKRATPNRASIDQEIKDASIGLAEVTTGDDYKNTTPQEPTSTSRGV